MSMPNRDTTFRYIGIAAGALLIFGLGGWYLFISRQTTDLENADVARGFAIGVPSFSGSRGSTAENIAVGFGAAPATEAAETEAKRPPRLWRVNTTPVAGMGFVSSGSTTMLRYIERSTGHIFDADPETGSVVRRTNRLIPKVYEAYAGKDDSIIARTQGDDGSVDTFSGKLGTTTVDGFVPLLGADLGPGITDIAFFGADEAVFLASRDGTTQLVRSRLDGSKPELLVSLPGGDFELSTLVDNRIVLTTRAASGIPGYSYEVGKGGVLSPFARATAGLTTLPRASSTALLIGTDTGHRLSLSLKASKDAAASMLPIQTVAEKCVWAPGISLIAYCAVPKTADTNFLTNWYRGKIHTTDTWFEVDGSAGKAESFFETGTDDAIDVERPMMDAQGDYIAFMSARDKSLWILRIIE